MKYVTFSEAVNQLSDGDIVFIKGKWSKITQALIMVVTRSRLTHCAIAFKAVINGNPHLMVVEAQGGNKRRIVSFNIYNSREFLIVPAPKPWSTVCDSALKLVGTEQYSWAEAIYVGLRDMFKKYMNISIPKLDFPDEICSEFIARVYDIADPEVSPQGLYDQIKKGA